MITSSKQLTLTLVVGLMLMAQLHPIRAQEDEEVSEDSDFNSDNFPVKQGSPQGLPKASQREDKKEDSKGLGLLGTANVVGSLFDNVGHLGGKLAQDGQKNSTESTGLIKPFADLGKVIFNPLELVKTISEFFKLPLSKFIDTIGSGLIFGVEAFLSPVVVSFKIIEKVFVPDACKLKLICKAGNQLGLFKDVALKFSPTFLEGSAQLKAFSDGVIGRECEKAFPGCGGSGEPKLKKPFDLLRTEKEPEVAASSKQATQTPMQMETPGANSLANKIIPKSS